MQAATVNTVQAWICREYESRLKGSKEQLNVLQRVYAEGQANLDQKTRVITNLTKQAEMSRAYEKDLKSIINSLIESDKISRGQAIVFSQQVKAKNMEIEKLDEQLRITKLKDVQRWKSKVDRLTVATERLRRAENSLKETNTVIKLLQEEVLARRLREKALDEQVELSRAEQTIHQDARQ